MRRIVDQRLDKCLLQYFSQDEHAHPPFSEEVLAPFKKDLDFFLQNSGFSPDWQVRPHQPMCLEILRCLNQLMRDPDHFSFPITNCRRGHGIST